jgi:glucosyl-dolichyl phosphate glucuronosyltransferase
VSGQAASIVIACYTEARWDSLVRAIESVRAQEPAPAQVIVAVDHNPSLCARLRDDFEGVAVVEHGGVPGASGTRNAGAAAASESVLVFADDDVQADPGWLCELIAPLSDPGVAGTGGMTKPVWPRPQPSWFPEEFAWVVGGSYAGLPTSPAAVRNVWSENMAVRREAFEAVGGFRGGFGKLGIVSRPEDTDLCLRISSWAPGLQWIYVPGAIVRHEVPPGRTTLSFFLRRCYWEGAGKVELSAQLGAGRNLRDERRYLLRTLPQAVTRDLRGHEVRRALAIVAGTCAAGLGAAVSLVRLAGSRLRW